MKGFKITKIALLAVVVGFILQSCGGIRLVEDDLSFLKGQKKLNILYDYSQISVGKYEKEEEYVNAKVEKFKEEDPQRAEEWKKSWVGDRKARFQPKFEELLSKYLEDVDLKVHPSFDNTKYTMIVKTTFIEPGYNIYISRKPASINLLIKIVETANPVKVIASIIVENALGESYGVSDFDTGERIKESYAKAGKEVGKLISNYLEE